MTFSKALDHLKKGGKVAREGWNGKGMFIFLQEGYPYGCPANENTRKAIGLNPGDVIRVRPYIAMLDAQGQIVSGWLASQTDLLSDDWEVIK
jgi:hypothetical protein